HAMGSSADVTATFCATLADEWRRAGIGHVVLSPGSRSTPLALALCAAEEPAVHVHHDERSAGFMALGIGLASGRPAIVLTTSGTAAAELHPAVVEAHQARVPLIVVTADRPPELQDVGAPRPSTRPTCSATRCAGSPHPACPTTTPGHVAPAAARAVAESTGATPGPVHLNLAFRGP
ncbi:MAG: thiamine pyrophosphate-binding protein, partial [Acidimicrobiales bacterium]